MKDIKWLLNLQLFAEGGEGGEAASGDNSVDAEQQALLDLGVPKSKIRKKAKVQAPVQVEQAQEQEQPATVDTPTEEQVDTPKRMTWDEIKADPEYNKEIQAIVQNRVKAAKQSEEKLQQILPTLELLARKYGQDPNNIDLQALNKAVNDDDKYYEDKAFEMGIPVETAKKLDQQEREAKRQEIQAQRTAEEQRIAEHIQKLEQQGNELKKTFPNFNLRVELQNPMFARLTAPGVGLSVEQAYYAIHRQEIDAVRNETIAKKTAERLSASIQAGQQRPQENGMSSQASSGITFDYRAMSKDQREAFKKDLKARLARGEKVFPQG